MKKAAWFVGLKITETAGVVLAYRLLVKWSFAFWTWAGDPPKTWSDTYVFGPVALAAIPILVSTALLAIFFGIKAWIKLNAEWADKLARR